MHAPQGMDPGGPAPEVRFEDGQGAPIMLSSLWARGPLALVFLRHLGWIFCREQLAQLRRAWPSFEERKVQVAAVSPAEGIPSAAVCGVLGSPFPCLGDPTGEAYDAFGLERGEMIQMFNLHTVSRGFWAFLRGHRQTKPIGDRSRLPGAFLVDGAGRVLWGHRGRDAADHPPASVILTAWDRVKGL